MRVFCEYLKNPVGIDLEHPRFSWIVPTQTSAQKSYQIIVTEPVSKREVWNTGLIESDQTVNIPYQGETLETARTYLYTIRSVTTAGETFESPEQFFTMGLMDKPVWDAPWIGGPWMEVQSFWFRTSFSIEKPVRSAYVYVISPNYYILTVNGKKCGDEVLQNANTEPKKTLLYATYPVNELLQNGENVLGVALGNGWHALNLGMTDVGLGEHMFSLKMRLEYEDGTCKWLDSNPDNWIYTKKGPVHSNSIYHGEYYDATDEIPGWDEPDFDISTSQAEWFDAVEFEPTGGIVKAQYLEPIRVVKELTPVEIYELEDGSYTFDMGQNFAGWARLRISGERGTKIRLVYSELKHPDHSVNQITLRHMRATDTYVLRGDDVEVYEPGFTFHGFRFVQVFGLPQKPDFSTLTGCVVRSDVEQIGHFSCDNALLNQLQSNICWTEESNLHSIPTDCPQRDERLGWTNDMTVRNECALYNYRLPALYTKWLGDIRDTQGAKTGAISDTAPFRVFGSHPGDPVGASFVLVPWNLYLYYQDKRVLEENYEPIRRYLAFLERNTTDYIIRWATMGDWAAPIGDNDAASIGGGAVSMVTPPRMIATAFFYYSCVLMSKMAGVLGHEKDVQYYQDLSCKIKDAFLRTYYNKAEKYVASNSQGCNTIALYMDLVPEEDRQAVLEHLVNDVVHKNNYHLTTGNMCSRYIIELLLTSGYKEVAYKLLTQTTYPSWGYAVEHGATTIWERWEEIVSECSLSIMASYNHPMYGAFGVCFYKYFAGIQVNESAPGFQNILIRPIIPEELKHTEASVDTIRGIVKSAWTVSDDTFTMQVTIPFNTTAKLYVPKYAVSLVMNGETFQNPEAAFTVVSEHGSEYYVMDVAAGEYVIEQGIN